jgi:hypothetical protein
MGEKRIKNIGQCLLNSWETESCMQRQSKVKWSLIQTIKHIPLKINKKNRYKIPQSSIVNKEGHIRCLTFIYSQGMIQLNIKHFLLLFICASSVQMGIVQDLNSVFMQIYSTHLFNNELRAELGLLFRQCYF